MIKIPYPSKAMIILYVLAIAGAGVAYWLYEKSNWVSPLPQLTVDAFAFKADQVHYMQGDAQGQPLLELHADHILHDDVHEQTLFTTVNATLHQSSSRYVQFAAQHMQLTQTKLPVTASSQVNKPMEKQEEGKKEENREENREAKTQSVQDKQTELSAQAKSALQASSRQFTLQLTGQVKATLYDNQRSRVAFTTQKMVAVHPSAQLTLPVPFEMRADHSVLQGSTLTGNLKTGIYAITQPRVSITP